MISDAIVSVGSLIVSPVFDFIKKKFLNTGKDNPVATMNALATTKPEVLPSYVEAFAHYIDAQVRYHNRDVVGKVLTWVGAIRQLIRPIAVISFIGMVAMEIHTGIRIPPEVRYPFEVNMGSWFGSRLIK